MYMAYTTNPHLPKLRMEAVNKVRTGWSVRQTARHFGVAPSTVSRWAHKAPKRSNAFIPTLSSRPHHHPNELSDDLIDLIIAYRTKYRRCAEVIQYFLAKDGIDVSLSSVKRTISRNNMAYPSKWKKWHTYPERPIATRPGILAEIDTVHIVIPESRIYVYTLLDTCSRYAYAAPSARINTHCSIRFVTEARSALPFPIGTLQSDHGPEFSKWFSKEVIRSGIDHRHSRVRKPTDNGHVERFNRTLKDECLSRVPRSLKSYRKAIPEFIHYYNTERPHMALDMQTPTEVLRSY